MSAISEDVDKQIYDAFFEGTSIYKVVDNKVYIMCESKLARQILRERYLDFITQKLHKYTASYYVPVLVTEEEMETKRIFDDSEVQPEFFKNNSLDPHFTFDNFVVGPCNSEAQKAALYTATSPGGMYQTLFIYGQSGLGKTHLLNAIGNYIMETILKTHLQKRKFCFVQATISWNNTSNMLKAKTKKKSFLSS